MRLVVDANILVAELIRVRGRKLIVRPELELCMAEKRCDPASAKDARECAPRQLGMKRLMN